MLITIIIEVIVFHYNILGYTGVPHLSILNSLRGYTVDKLYSIFYCKIRLNCFMNIIIFIFVYLGILSLFSTLVDCCCFKCAKQIHFDLT